jgi:CPA2 family monovalent cation:H+ antiporter-2
MHLPILQDLLIILGFSALVVFILQKFRLPSILGFLITGMIIGPGLLGLIRVEEVEILAEIGVILLLFVIGMELSIKHLVSIRKTVFISGFFQVGITVFITGAAYFLMGNSISEAVFIGFLFSLSSTAIVLQLLQDRHEISLQHGRNALAILIFQDIIVVPMMLVTPLLAGEVEAIGMELIILAGKSLLVVLITFLSARYLVPKFMYIVVRTRSKELFLTATIFICFMVAFLTSKAGLSLALGAFLAGLIISESEYSHQATGIILPFKELFTSVFFISVGMMLDIEFFFGNFLVIILIVIAVAIIKALVATTAILILRYPTQSAIITGISLFQVGEFAFILSQVGLDYQLLDPQTNQYFLAVSIVSMLLTPFAMIFSKKIAIKSISKVGFLKNKEIIGTDADTEAFAATLENHLVIIGCGLNGSNLAKAAEHSDIPFIVIEMDPKIVLEEKGKGIPVLFGDATNEYILEVAGVKGSSVVVVAISDLINTKEIIKKVRILSRSAYLIIRTRYINEIEELLALGADEVIPEEFETSVKIFSSVLHSFLVPEEEIEHIIQLARSDNYNLFASRRKLPKTVGHSRLQGFHVTCLTVNQDSGRFVGKTIGEVQLRAKYGITLVSIQRDENMIFNITPEERILQHDKLYILGDQDHILQFYKLIH